MKLTPPGPPNLYQISLPHPGLAEVEGTEQVFGDWFPTGAVSVSTAHLCIQMYGHSRPQPPFVFPKSFLAEQRGGEGQGPISGTWWDAASASGEKGRNDGEPGLVLYLETDEGVAAGQATFRGEAAGTEQ